MTTPMTSDVDINHSILPILTSVSNKPKIDKQGHAVIVLASGLSQRLGQSKQLLKKNGEPVIRYMIKIALATKPHAVIVVIPQNQPMIAHAINKLASQNIVIQSVVNLIPETGMADSLYLGIEALAGLKLPLIKRVLIMGIDQVLLGSEHLMTLLAGTEAVVASSYRHLNEKFLYDIHKDNIIGLPITIEYELLKRWQPILIGDKGLRDLIRALPSSHMRTVVNHQLSFDVDTPNQLLYARQQGWLDN